MCCQISAIDLTMEIELSAKPDVELGCGYEQPSHKVAASDAEEVRRATHHRMFSNSTPQDIKWSNVNFKVGSTTILDNCYGEVCWS